jgi:hypothetical protein
VVVVTVVAAVVAAPAEAGAVVAAADLAEVATDTNSTTHTNSNSLIIR